MWRIILLIFIFYPIFSTNLHGTIKQEQHESDTFFKNISPEGAFKIGDQRFCFKVATNNWKWIKPDSANMIAAPGFPKQGKNEWSWQGKLNLGKRQINMEQKIFKLENNIVVEVILEDDKPFYIDFAGMYISLSIAEFAGRQLIINGKEIKIPVLPDKTRTILDKGTQLDNCRISFQEGNNDWIVSSNGAYCFMDSRRWGPEFVLRLAGIPGRGAVKKTTFKMQIRNTETGTIPIELSSVANRAFADEVDQDGKGGWTDQGPENDLRMMIPGEYRWRGAHFKIIDPTENNGKSCIVFNSKKKEVSLALKKQDFKYLALVHAITQRRPGEQIGLITATYSDGTSDKIPVISGKHVGNWWGAVSLAEAPVVWKGKSRSGDTRGLYLSVFPLSGKPLTDLTFSNSSTPGDWMIVAATGCENKPNITTPGAHFITAGKNWRPISLKHEVKPGSILDFSSFCDAPAGKHGKIISRNGQFEFEKRLGKKVRLFGTNLCFTAAFPDHKTAERLTAQLAAQGYNSVRFHHQDFYMEPRNSKELDPTMMDKMDYFFYCLKKAGIYVVTDLHAHRFTAYKIPGLKGWYGIGAFRALALKHPEAVNDWKRFAANFMTHVNPYTGIAYKDDPGLATICLINEGNLDYWINHSEYSIVPRFYDDEFKKWLDAKGLKPETQMESMEFQKTFFREIQLESFREKTEFLRSLGVRQLLTDQNMHGNTPYMVMMRNHYDFVEDHAYFDHPTNAMLPSTLSNRSSLDNMSMDILGQWLPSRIFGKPFSITEYNWCFPNKFRAESGQIIGSYAALQGYSALYRFAYAHRKELYDNESEIKAFDICNDPINLYADRITALLFLRGDVSESNLFLPIQLRNSDIGNKEEFNQQIKCLGLIGKTGCLIENDNSFQEKYPFSIVVSENLENVPALLKKYAVAGKAVLDMKNRFARSSSGEIELDGKNGTMRTITPQSEALTLTQSGKITGNIVDINSDSPASFMLASMDGAHLEKSRKMLFFHLTDAKNTNTHFMNQKETVIDQYGTTPVLIARGKAEIYLKLEGSELPAVYALDMSGNQVDKITSCFENGILHFTVDTMKNSVPALAYEIIR
jgi:hypothetical protein